MINIIKGIKNYISAKTKYDNLAGCDWFKFMKENPAYYNTDHLPEGRKHKYKFNQDPLSRYYDTLGTGIYD